MGSALGRVFVLKIGVFGFLIGDTVFLQGRDLHLLYEAHRTIGGCEIRISKTTFSGIL